MGDEIAKQPSWEERQEIARKKAEELLYGHTTEDAIRRASKVADEAAELHDLVAWYTEAFDEKVAGLNGNYATSTQVTSAARRAVKEADPEKFARLRDLEKTVAVRNAQHQAVADAAHASIVEANLKNMLLWT